MKSLLRASLVLASVGMGHGLNIGDECRTTLTPEQSKAAEELRRISPDMLVLPSCDDDDLRASCVPDANSSLGGYCRSNRDILQSSSNGKDSGLLRAGTATANANSGTCALAVEDFGGMNADDLCEEQKEYGVERPSATPDCAKAGSLYEMSSLNRNGMRAHQTGFFPCCLDECCKDNAGDEGTCDGAGHMCRTVRTGQRRTGRGPTLSPTLGPRAQLYPQQWDLVQSERPWKRCDSASDAILAQE